MKQVLSLSQFLAGLQGFVADINHIIVATYNNVCGYEQGGEFSVGDKKLSIFCGGAAHANVETFFGAVPNPGAQETKDAGAKKISAELEGVSSDSMVILYAGASRLAQFVNLAYELAGRGIKVVLVGCGCDEDVFERYEANDNIIFVVPIHSDCNGGRQDLANIVNQLLK